MSQQIYWRDSKLTFLQIDDQAKVLKKGENSSEILRMLMFTWAEHKNVININKNTIQPCKNCIHQLLKNLSGIPESKRDLDEIK